MRVDTHNGFHMILGLPRSGKTTLLQKIANYHTKKGRKVYSNVPLENTYKIEIADIGKYQIENAVILLDECGVYLNNRKWKSTPQEFIEWTKYVGHYKCLVYLASQAEDFEVTLARMCQSIWLCRKIGKRISMAAHIKVILDVDDTGQCIIKRLTKESIIGALLNNEFTWMPKYWKGFNSFECKKLEDKMFNTWYDNNAIIDKHNAKANRSKSNRNTHGMGTILRNRRKRNNERILRTDRSGTKES